MKGTLFSADFVFDSSNNARLLEINTDTSLTTPGNENLDFTDFGTVLSDSSLDTLHIIFKPFHQLIVDKLVDFVNNNVSNITIITFQEEETCSLYVGAVEDASNKFILRMAYDEAAILDSEYAKSEIKLYSLFNTNSDLDSLPPSYHSSSVHGIIDTISQSFNDPNIPDFVKKTENASGATLLSIGFLKAGLPETGSDYRLNTLIEEQKKEDVLISNFLPNLSGSYTTSVRSMQIVYGNDLDLCFVGEHQQVSLFDIPSSITTGSLDGSDKVSHEVHQKHRHEFTTNHPKYKGGLIKTTNILSSSGDAFNIQTLNSGSDYFYQSYFVSGSPDTDAVTELNDWFYSGSNFPSGSYLTSSNVILVEENLNPDLDIYKLELESGDTFLLGSVSLLPVLDTGSNVITWKSTEKVLPGNKVFDENNTSYSVVSNTYQISDTNGEYDLYQPNMEVIDTYILKGSSMNLLVHNPFGAGRGGCFIKGTEITLPNGDNKAIEDITQGEEILTHNHDSGLDEVGVVGFIETLEANKIIKITTDGKHTKEITCTLEHPFYANGKYIQAEYLEVMDLLHTNYGEDVFISKVEILDETHTVYNLRDVSDNHNFYANNILVHNK